MSLSAFLRAHCGALPRIVTILLLVCLAVACPAASIRGVVTDSTGTKVTGTNVSLISNGRVVGSAVSVADGSFEILTGTEGRFFLIASAKTFRQLETPSFYAGRLDSIERTLVLEPEWVRESIVVTATGTPTPQPQTSETTSVLGPLDLALRSDLTSALRLMPGTVSVQDGQLGAQTSLFVRGGNSDANKILLDGVDAGDLGNGFDVGPLSTTAVQSVEVYRGPDSSLYGAGAGSSVVSLTTPHGTTSFPSILFQGDAGSFQTSREELEVAGAHNKLDYLGAFSWMQTANDLPLDEYHVATTAANIGWQPNAATQLRGTLHYGVDETGVPGAWDFYQVANNATLKDQDLFISTSVDNQTTPDFHNSLRYGLTRKREQYKEWHPGGVLINQYDPTCYGSAYFGNYVIIAGANGYSMNGQAMTACDGNYPKPSEQVSNRDQLSYQGDYRITPHFAALAGFHYENERGSEPGSTYYTPVTRNNYDYLASVHGDYKQRFFYTLGGSLEHYSLFGVQNAPHAGLTYYALRPRNGVFSGTRILFNFGKGVREPKLTDQDDSLYNFLLKNGGQATIQQLNIAPISAPTTRSYEGGVEQGFFTNRMIFRASYFHNEFGNEIEYVGMYLVPQLLPNLSAAQQQNLLTTLSDNYAYELTLNTEAFRAQGIEATVESGIGHYVFLRGGYTYLDAVIQRSFSNNDTALLGPIPTAFGIPVGVYAPLEGARPFRRPPHTGFFTATYAQKQITAVFTSSFASRSDDSTFLAGYDVNGGDTLLLPNRNLDWGYAKLDLGASFKLLSWLSLYGQAENLTNNQHIAPIGYPSLPFNARLGLRFEWTKATR